MTDIKKEIDLLIEKINKWNKEYFDNNSPSVSDRVYDTHLRKLANLEKKYPQFLREDSPTNIIGAKILNKFNKVIHNKKMLSLNKAYSYDDVLKFVNDVLKVVKKEDVNFYIEPKIDGLSISLKYQNGQLIQASTRGDGIAGEDVTDNVFNIIKDIPSFIDYKNNLEIRGEIYISKSNFLKMQNIESKFANPRNMASGTLRQIDKNIVKERELSCFIYEIIDPELHNIHSYDKALSFLKKNNFKILENGLLTNNTTNIIDFIAKFNEIRKTLNYETDGLVIKLNEMLYYDQIGFTSKFPKYNIAYKYDDDLVETKLIGITITIGRTGMVTYNGQVEPVLLKSTIVSAATLHNFNYINNLNINVNDNVMIKKAGEIIPKIVSLSKKNSQGKFTKITICPFCQKELIDNELLTDQFCVNDLCPEINIRKIIHFVSKKGMNIVGLGESWIRKFFELGIIKRISDIYLMEAKQDLISQLDGMGITSFNNLLRSIENSKTSNLSSLLYALGINHLGERNCQIIAKEIVSFDQFIKFDFNKLNNNINIKDIGPITLNSIIEFQNNLKNIEDINKLLELQINPKEKKIVINKNNFFNNKTFVITGKFNLNRHKLKEIIEQNGGKVLSSVSQKTNYLICGTNYSSKKEKADELKIKIIFEEEIMEFIKQI